MPEVGFSLEEIVRLRERVEELESQVRRMRFALADYQKVIMRLAAYRSEQKRARRTGFFEPQQGQEV